MEHEYIKRIINGEIELYGYFLDTYGNRVYALVQRIINNREDAEDLTQEVFIKAFESLRSYRGECQFSTWLYRIACNLTTTVVRKKARQEPPIPVDDMRLDEIDSDIFDEQFSSEPDDEHQELLDDLQLAISWLSEEERGLITLFYYEEKSVNECAYILRQSENNIKVQLYRARKKLSLYLYRIKHGNEQQS